MTQDNVYSSAKYEIWVCDSFGNKLGTIDNFISMNCSRAFGSIGRFSVIMAEDTFDNKLISIDNIIQIWRSPVVGTSSLVFAGFIRGRKYRDNNGKDEVHIRGLDGVSLLKTRIVAYTAGSAQSSKTAAADNMMKAIVRENLDSLATDATRRLNTFNFTTDTDHTKGVSFSKKFAWRNVLDVLNEITDKSIDDGSPIYFDVVPFITGAVAGWRFITGLNYLGTNKTYASSNPTLFSREFGNLESPELDEDYAEEITYVYAGGEGEGSLRQVGTAIDTGREELSPWNRREQFVNYSIQESPSALTDRAKQAVQAGRPRSKFAGNLKDTPQTRFGLDWKYGDLVSISYRDRMFDGVVNGVSITIRDNKEELIQARVEAVL